VKYHEKSFEKVYIDKKTEMRRDKISDLIKWKNSDKRKPLIIRGARQVGKTWLMKEFGSTYYKQMIYVNLEKQKRLHSLFTDDFDIDSIITALQIESDLTIDAENTLIVLDEIQEIPKALTTLKYFFEDAPQYHIMVAGSLLGVAMHSGISFPVGKVDFLDLNPLSYNEFLEACGNGKLVKLLKSPNRKLVNTYKERYIEFLKYYYFVGGMPEAVLKFTKGRDFKAVRNIQNNILEAYQHDFSKHAPIDIVPRIRMVWDSIPAQLAKENRKFIYGLIKTGSRAKDFELALAWLNDCRQAYKVHRVSKPSMPLKAYEYLNAFKLFIVDIGLLSAMADLDIKTLVEGNDVFTEFKGALTEQYVFQQLLNFESISINYWSAEKSTAEIDFVIQVNGDIIPVEVKAEENLQAKSLRVYIQKFDPAKVIRTSMSDYREEDKLISVPLFAIGSYIA
jgi:predicted AAA+ superfamily ATPase